MHGAMPETRQWSLWFKPCPANAERWEYGLIQPIPVRPNADGFEIVAGPRRYCAGQMADHSSIPARIVEFTMRRRSSVQLVENSQRVDVHPYEEAQCSSDCWTCPVTQRLVDATSGD